MIFADFSAVLLSCMPWTRFHPQDNIVNF